jgi:hypothetical protein
MGMPATTVLRDARSVLYGSHAGFRRVTLQAFQGRCKEATRRTVVP